MGGLLDQRTGEDRPSGDVPIERARMSIVTVAAVIVFIVGLLATYFASVNTVNARVSVLESQRQSDKESLQRIEQKVDQLLYRSRPQ